MEDMNGESSSSCSMAVCERATRNNGIWNGEWSQPMFTLPTPFPTPTQLSLSSFKLLRLIVSPSLSHTYGSMPEMPGMDTRACKRKAEEAGINDPRIRSANAVSSLSDNNKSVSRREYELMKHTLMQRVADLDAKVIYHQEELNWKDAILRHKNEQLDGKDQRIHILENNLNNERARKEKLKEEIRQQQKDIKEQDEKLKRRDLTIVHQRRMIDTYTDQNDSLREQNSEIRNDLQKLASRWA